MLRVGVCVSGGGTNLQAIIDKVENGTITNTELCVVISNNAGAYALERAKAIKFRRSVFLRRIMRAGRPLMRRFWIPLTVIIWI